MSRARHLVREIARPLDATLLWMIGGVLLLSVLVQYSMLGQAAAPVADHVLRIAFGLAVLVLIAHVSPAQLYKWTALLVAGNIILLVLIPLFGGSGPAQRWLDLQVIAIQPSELLKLTLPLAAAAILSGAPLPPTFLRTSAILVLFGGCAAMVMLQPDLGTAALVMGIGMAMLFLAGISRRLVLLAFALAAGSLPFLWKYALLEYQKDRVRTFLDPQSDPLGAGYNIIQSKISIGSGGVTGQGWTQGSQGQYDFLPEQSTDFVFAAFAEEFGLIGVAVLFLLYVGILLRLARYFEVAESPYQRFLIGGFGLSLLMHILLNVAMTIGYAPVTGSPLPLMSYGGSFLFATLASLGICMAIRYHTSSRGKVALS